MEKFELITDKIPNGDQPKAIKELIQGLEEKKRFQVLLGATGTGKTFTIANVIQKYNKPTLVLAHNKTLANQLYYELKELFPNNRVEYFVSYFDFYKPEAYIPGSDMYLEKQSQSNRDLEIMRMSTLNSLLNHNDTIVVASVAAIYGARDPQEYRNNFLELNVGEKINRKDLLFKLISIGYKRNDKGFSLGEFKVIGDVVDIRIPTDEENHIRVEMFDDEIERITQVNTINNSFVKSFSRWLVIPGDPNVLSENLIEQGIRTIETELEERLKYFDQENLLIEKQRLEQRTKFDIEQLKEFGMVSGIENYAFHFENRNLGEPPFTMIDYFPKDFLAIIDESHISLPQVNGMYKGDRARKETLVKYGFRLPTALENRPLRYDEFEDKLKQAIFVSATPGDYELKLVDGKYTEQIIRPTGLLDPIVEVRKSINQIDDIIEEIKKRREVNERVFVNTITIKMSEEITSYLNDKGINAAYIHSELKTLERSELIRKLRLGIYDAIVGINLLREGLDVPEVSLITILDADKEGFLRNDRSLIQMIGRVARNINGKVIMYADKTTRSMNFAIEETRRRRLLQEEFNLKNNIIPQTIIKEIPKPLLAGETSDFVSINRRKGKKYIEGKIKELEKEMREASKEYNFERAIELRDLILELKGEI